jgi:hypothetical protein
MVRFTITIKQKTMSKIFYLSILVFSTLLFAGCDKETDWRAESQAVPTGRPFLKINYASAYAANPSVILSINDARVSNSITARTPFPGGGYNTGGGSQGDYLTVPAGSNKLAISIPSKNFYADSVVLFTTTLNLDPDKFYSAHIADTGSKTKILLTQDDLTQPDTGQVKFRFINLIPNVTAIDLYYGTTLVAGNVPYLTSSPYFTMRVPATRADWIIRETGTGATGTILASYAAASNANTTISQRVYTAFAMGYKGQTTTARRPYISFYLMK